MRFTARQVKTTLRQITIAVGIIGKQQLHKPTT